MPSVYVPVDLQRAGFTPNRTIGQSNRVVGGRVNIRSEFKYNTRFPQQWSKDIRTIQLWNEMVGLTVNAAKRKVRVRTGALRDSIRGELSTGTAGMISGSVSAGGPEAFYWAFIEYGTGARGAGSDQPDPGRPVGYGYNRSWKGNRAYPFLRPALIELRARIQSLPGARLR